MSNNTLDNVTNKLLMEYDTNFNDLYDTKLAIDTGIVNKENIDVDGRLSYDRKNFIINILHFSVYAVIVLSAILIAHAMAKINDKQLLIAIVVLSILYAIGFWAIKKNTDPTVIVQQAAVQIGDNGVKLLKPFFQNTYQCPIQCPPLFPTVSSETNEEDYPDGPMGYGSKIKSFPHELLRTQSQNNVWVDGDIPNDINTTPENYNKLYLKPRKLPIYLNNEMQKQAAEPKPFFRGIDKKFATYYKCQNNNGKNNNIPRFSSIPCSYKPNYSEVGRYICSSDPSESSANCENDDCSNICKKVTNLWNS